MNVCRWFGCMVVLGGLMHLFLGAGQQLTLQAQEKDKDKDKEKGKQETGGEVLEWKAFSDPKKVFYQELTTDTTQNMKVMGQDIVQKQTQTFYIEWKPQEKDKEGNYVVTQKIVGVDMSIDIGGNKITYKSNADPQPANPMADFFKVLQNLELKLTIKPGTMEVTKIEGGEDFIKKLGATNPAMEPLLKNILSDKALKQMAEPTWGALPSKAVSKGSTWEKTTELDLGPIGTYKTKYTYTYEGTDKDKGDKIKVDAALTYGVPGKKDGLPFEIKSATLSSKEGTGYAYFDRKAGRFSSSSMNMKLEGTLKIEVGGMTTDVDLNQTQVSTTKTRDDNPMAKQAEKKSQ